MALTPSEELVEQLSRASFLSPWSYANPRARAGKELCDLLVVCDPDVVIFSVKEIGLRDPDDLVAVERWRKKAIDQSLEQLYGAERWLSSAQRVLQADGSEGLPLPSSDSRRIHRVAVALGSEGQVGFEQGDFGRGFVHVLDDASLRTVMGELDTISDLVSYLSAKEALITAGTTPIVSGGEQDMLAVYLHTGRSFPNGANVLVFNHGAWNELTSKPDSARRKDADRLSYFWDGLIERVAREARGPGLEIGSAEEMERVMRVMAREDRFSRRVLSEAFHEFIKLASAGQVRSRIVPSLSGVYYVFLAADATEQRQERGRELILRCIVARSRMAAENGSKPVVGLATERYQKGSGSSLDAVLVHLPTWTPEWQEKAEGIVRDLGYFAAPRLSRAQGDEYPSEPSK
jgi:hypothetical protein